MPASPPGFVCAASVPGVSSVRLPDIVLDRGGLLEATRDERFERLFREHYAAVRGYALRRTVRDVVPDVVSETFLIAWRRLDDVPDDALPWLYGVARRVLANQRRSAGRRAALEDRLAATSSVGDVRDPAESIHDAELVRRALARLPEPYREALMLVAWHGLSGARAARAAGCSRTAFGVRLHRARGALKREISALEPRAAAGEARSLEVS